MLPADDLPFWQQTKNMTSSELATRVGATAEEFEEMQGRGSYGATSPTVAGKIRDRLLQDLDTAIRRRRDATEP
jgi:hypothetical protein